MAAVITQQKGNDENMDGRQFQWFVNEVARDADTSYIQAFKTCWRRQYKS